MYKFQTSPYSNNNKSSNQIGITNNDFHVPELLGTISTLSTELEKQVNISNELMNDNEILRGKFEELKTQYNFRFGELENSNINVGRNLIDEEKIDQMKSAIDRMLIEKKDLLEQISRRSPNSIRKGSPSKAFQDSRELEQLRNELEQKMMIEEEIEKIKMETAEIDNRMQEGGSSQNQKKSIHTLLRKYGK